MKKKVRAYIEQACDGTYSVYMDADNMDYCITGTGTTKDEAVQMFLNGYEDMKQLFAKQGKEFIDAEFEFEELQWYYYEKTDWELALENEDKEGATLVILANGRRMSDYWFSRKQLHCLYLLLKKYERKYS